eukprot:139654_1
MSQFIHNITNILNRATTKTARFVKPRRVHQIQISHPRRLNAYKVACSFIWLLFIAFVCAVITYILYYRITEKAKKFNAYTTSEEAINGMDLTNKYCIITGGNSGIGKQTTKILFQQGCNVIIACRNIEKANIVGDDIQKNEKSISQNNKIIVMKLDLSSLQSVKDFVINYTTKYKQLNYLINNAGVMAFRSFIESKDGYEKQFAVNHIGHFYLTQLLLEILLKNKTRIIVLSSTVVNWITFKQYNNFLNKSLKNKCGPLIEDYGIMKNYEFSKVANILFVREFNRRYEKHGIIAVSLHPGVINTNISQHFDVKLSDIPGLLRFLTLPFNMENRKNMSQGAATTLRCVSMSNDEIVGGEYYFNCQSAIKYNRLKGAAKPRIYKDYENNSLEIKLWNLTELLIKQKGFDFKLQ